MVPYSRYAPHGHTKNSAVKFDVGERGVLTIYTPSPRDDVNNVFFCAYELNGRNASINITPWVFPY